MMSIFNNLNVTGKAVHIVKNSPNIGSHVNNTKNSKLNKSMVNGKKLSVIPGSTRKNILPPINGSFMTQKGNNSRTKNSKMFAKSRPERALSANFKSKNGGLGMGVMNQA